MDTWNREELYRDIWQEPMLKLSKKYGVSGVMLGRICRKLSIPVPGRGYWARKSSGYSVAVKLLPKVKNIPVIQRFKLPDDNPPEVKVPEPEPTDPEYRRILEIEKTQTIVDPSAPLHRIVAATIKSYKAALPDSNGYRKTNGRQGALSLNITDGTFERAIPILNAVAFALEKEQLPLKVHGDPKRVTTSIFEQEISFEIFEKYRIVRIPENERKHEFLGSKVRFEGNGILEIRVFDDRFGKATIRDHQKSPIERHISAIVATFVRQARSAKLAAERKHQQEIERRERQSERFKLSEQIREEEKKLENLDTWVTNWSRARLYREFILALDESWKARGEDLSDGGERAARLLWMRQQADRLDPLVLSPSSILDRKGELHWY